MALDVPIPVVDPYGSVFRLLRSVELPFSLFRVEDTSEIAADAPFAILSSYGKADAAVVEELADRVPTVVYAVQPADTLTSIATAIAALIAPSNHRNRCPGVSPSFAMSR